MEEKEYGYLTLNSNGNNKKKWLEVSNHLDGDKDLEVNLVGNHEEETVYLKPTDVLALREHLNYLVKKYNLDV